MIGLLQTVNLLTQATEPRQTLQSQVTLVFNLGKNSTKFITSIKLIKYGQSTCKITLKLQLLIIKKLGKKALKLRHLRILTKILQIKSTYVYIILKFSVAIATFGTNNVRPSVCLFVCPCTSCLNSSISPLLLSLAPSSLSILSLSLASLSSQSLLHFSLASL